MHSHIPISKDHFNSKNINCCVCGKDLRKLTAKSRKKLPPNVFVYDAARSSKYLCSLHYEEVRWCCRHFGCSACNRKGLSARLDGLSRSGLVGAWVQCFKSCNCSLWNIYQPARITTTATATSTVTTTAKAKATICWSKTLVQSVKDPEFA